MPSTGRRFERVDVQRQLRDRLGLASLHADAEHWAEPVRVETKKRLLPSGAQRSWVSFASWMSPRRAGPVPATTHAIMPRLTVELSVEDNTHVETIQVVMEGELLRRVDKVARRLKLNRSALIRQALRRHLKELQLRTHEEADRRGYERTPEDADALSAWGSVASWPED